MDDYWRFHKWNLQVIAARAVRENPGEWKVRSEKRKRDRDDDRVAETKGKKSKIGIRAIASQEVPVQSKPDKLYNPYEGESAALQINESVDSFLQRLKPSSTDISEPWIYCANFHSEERPTKCDIAGFKQVGQRLLEKILVKRQELEAKFDPPKAEGAITRMMAPDRAKLEAEIMTAAKKHGITSGKWMLFPTPDKVDAYWAAVVKGTVEGRLGTAAKVATKPGKQDESTQLICVYTKDISDEEDIKRVLKELVRLKCARAITSQGPGKSNIKGQIWYKPDCYTYLDITSGNEHKIKPTLYGSGSLLTSADVRGLG